MQPIYPPILDQSASRILLCEGLNDGHVTLQLCVKHNLPKDGFQIRHSGGYGGLPRDVETLLEKSATMQVLGVVFDAEGLAATRWLPFAAMLREIGFADVPEEPLQGGIALTAPPDPARDIFGKTVGIWIMPDNKSVGMLEDFFVQLVPDSDVLLPHAATTIDNLPGGARFQSIHRSKALVSTWLAWQQSPGSLMGLAIQQGSVNSAAPIALEYVGWLRRLFSI